MISSDTKLVQIPPGVSWYVWRIVKSRLGSLRDIEETWSIDDLCDAHYLLDAFEGAAQNR